MELKVAKVQITWPHVFPIPWQQSKKIQSLLKLLGFNTFYLLFHVSLLNKLLYFGPTLMHMFIKCCNLFITSCQGHIVLWYFLLFLNLKIMIGFFHYISNNIVLPLKRCACVVTNILFFPKGGVPLFNK